jgi:hypothetical protein
MSIRLHGSDRGIVGTTALLLASLLAGAPPTAAAEPQAPAPVAAVESEAVYAIFESVCLSGGEIPAGFEAAACLPASCSIRLNRSASNRVCERKLIETFARTVLRV